MTREVGGGMRVTLETRPLHRLLGVEIVGVDVRHVDTDVFVHIVDAPTSAGTTDKAMSDSVEKKNEVVAYGKKLMTNFDAKSKDLEGQISRDSSAAKSDAQRQLKNLKAQRAETGKKLDELGRASRQSWDSWRHGFADAYRNLQGSYDKLVASLKK